jgi:hypothetical protein
MSKLLGHATPEITACLYQYATADLEEAIAATMDTRCGDL